MHNKWNMKEQRKGKTIVVCISSFRHPQRLPFVVDSFLWILYLFAQFPGFSWIDKCWDALVAPSSADGYPNMLLGSSGVDCLSISGPSQTRLSLHRAVTESIVGHPLFDNIFDKFDLSAKIVRCRDTLNLWVDLWSPPCCGGGCSCWCSGLEVE
jgi:hypothetical protein